MQVKGDYVFKILT